MKGRAAAVVVALGLLAGIGATTADSQMILTRAEVRHVEVGQVIGKPGLKIRVVLASNQVIDFTVDAEDGAATMRLLEPFLSGGARLYAELDGNRVAALHVVGPKKP